jgi:xanthine dehydrogenase accessory factor
MSLSLWLTMATLCEFTVTVLDDRPQYADRTRFPTAHQVVAGPFRDELRRLRGNQPTFDPHTCLVLVTRGHQHDVELLLEVLDDPLAYLGMIGSRRRIRAVFELLERQRGIPATDLTGSMPRSGWRSAPKPQPRSPWPFWPN